MRDTRCVEASKDHHDYPGAQRWKIDALCGYTYPGNIRELANLVEQLIVLTPEEQIKVEDLPDHVLKGKPRSTSSPTSIIGICKKRFNGLIER